jgi:hypothetical protein
LSSLEEQLASGGASPSRSGKSQQSAGDRSAEEEARTLQVVVSSLREELSATIDAARTEKQRLEATCRELTQQAAKEKEQAQRCRQDLLERPSREEFIAMRKQLRMVTKIAFNVQDEDLEV